MIYFDKNKKAYAYEIENYLTSISDTVWQQHCNNEVGTSWDIVEGKFIDMTNSTQYQNFLKKQKAESRCRQIKQQLKDIDEKRIRALSEEGLREDGKSWLDYYNEQALQLRMELKDLGGK